jgi:hypothetical protein
VGEKKQLPPIYFTILLLEHDNKIIIVLKENLLNINVLQEKSIKILSDVKKWLQ